MNDKTKTNGVRRKRRKTERQFFYLVKVNGWELHASFNDYAYINIFDNAPFEERYYMTLTGVIDSAMSKKVKEGRPIKVVLHPSEDWYSRGLAVEDDDSIGNMEVYRDSDSRKQILIARISMPTKSFNLIKASLLSQSNALVQIVGTDFLRRKAEIYHISFSSKNSA